MKLGTTKGSLNKLILADIIIIVLLFLGYQAVKISNMPPMEDIYISSFDAWAEDKETIIYKYDAQIGTVEEVGRVSGYFFHCKIDREKKYIVGLRNATIYPPEEEKEMPGVEFGVVRFSLSDGTSEVILSYDEIKELETGKLLWEYSFPCGDGEKIELCYHNKYSTIIVYDIEKGEKTRIARPDKAWYVYDIRNDIIWYRAVRKGRNNDIVKYNMTTREKKIIVPNVDEWNCAISDDGTKIAFLKGGIDDIYLYDVNRKKEKRISKSSINSGFESVTFYSSEWDRSGNYYYYIEHASWIIGGSTRIKAYNVQTGTSKCVCSFPSESSKYRFWEFIRHAE